MMVGLATLLIRVFFRQVDVEHRDRLGSDQPTVLVAVHRNGLVDALLLMAALRRCPRFLGKSTLFRNPLLWPFLKLAGVVPVYRAQDGMDTGRNADAFAASNRLLAGGGTVAVFPEGISHDQPSVQALRTGAARIALQATADGVDGVVTVPVALLYDDRQRFRSRALVRVGMVEPTTRWGEDFRIEPRRTTRDLTEHLAGQLRAATPDHATWSEARRLDDIAGIVVRKAADLPVEVDLADRYRIASALGAAAISGTHAAAADALDFAYDTYQRDLALLGVTDAQVTAGYRSGRLRWSLLGAVAKVVAAIPVAAVGVAIHVVPYELIKLLSRIPDNRSVAATVKVIGSFVTYLAVYVTVGVVASAQVGWWAGVAAGLLAPACGYVAVRLAERLRRMWTAIDGYRMTRDQAPLLASVRRNRRAVVDAAVNLLDGAGPTPAAPDLRAPVLDGSANA
jgi:1-acyl-sn-glycerol-3-phosphate acyltransferase